MINNTQEAQFKMWLRINPDSFDPEPIIESLREYEELWRGAIMDRSGHVFLERIKRPVIEHDLVSSIDLIKLRDIGDDHWNVDTMFILASGVDDVKLELLATTWGADEVSWLDWETDIGFDIGSRPTSKFKVLRVWWD